MEVANFSSFTTGRLPELASLRQHIHAHPELAFEEKNTAKYIIEFLQKLSNPPEIVTDIGGTGFLAIFNFSRSPDHDSVKTVVFRSELDAVPVLEKNHFSHLSTNTGVSHQCGHDGHMAILAGLALLLSDHYQPTSGRVVLLFQPAEETGAGAQRMIDSGNKTLDSIIASPHSSIYALHNVPGFAAGSIVLPRSESFASASKGVHIKLKGACCHASQPHLGHNPAPAMCNIVMGLLAMPTLYIPYDQKAIVTIVGARVGEKAFGVSAGDAEVMATIRATTDEALDILEQKANALTQGVALTYGLKSSIEYEDAFAAVVNSTDSVEVVRTVASQLKYNLHWTREAFPWSEDFGIYLQRMKGAMFGLGCGQQHDALHADTYDFPDAQIVTGVSMFASIVKCVLGQSQGSREA